VVSSYLLVALLVFAVNLLPAFAPPTWAVLVLLQVNSDLLPVPLILIGATCAACGRLVLATTFRHLRRWLPRRYVSNTQAAGELVMSHRRASVLGIGLFVLSPLPSAQLFEAAGLMAVRLLPLTFAFFVGRLVSYSLYVGGVHAARGTPVGQLVTDSLTSPWAIALQVLMLVGIVAVGRVDWAGAYRRRHPQQQEQAQT
jgi:membrane protein YqaA with SNARE-associated domain